jgi:hypothetical protein
MGAQLLRTAEGCNPCYLTDFAAVIVSLHTIGIANSEGKVQGVTNVTSFGGRELSAVMNMSVVLATDVFQALECVLAVCIGRC